MPKRTRSSLRRRALLVHQSDDHPLYLFTLSGQELLALADISRVSRDDADHLIGYQRPEVRRHVDDIVTYLNGSEVLFPNSIILALSSRVRFTRSRGPQVDDGDAAAGILEIPLPGAGERRPAWIVDGQQRTLALSRSRRQGMRVPVSAFIADDVESQRDQFLRVNNTKPLPRGLITELLPEISGVLPQTLAARKIPAALTEQLAVSDGSPFKGLIRQSSRGRQKQSSAVVADTSVVKMIEESLTTPSGCLFPYRNLATGETDTATLWRILVTYWTAVRETFPDAWGRPAAQSRLMHGVGIRAMGRLMDKVIPVVSLESKDVVRQIRSELVVIADVCHWTKGEWEELGNLPWNELQNVPRHIRAVSSLLIRRYVQTRVRR